MEVGRLYNLDSAWYAIQRLWSRVTVFCEYDSETGRAMNLKRLKEFRDNINVVIKELEEEQEMESWLS